MQCRSTSVDRKSHEDAAAVLDSRFEITEGREARWGEMAPTIEVAENCLRLEASGLCVGRVRRALLDGLRDIILGNR